MSRREINIKKLEEKLEINSLKDYLYDLYINQLKTTREISHIIYGNNQNYNTIIGYLRYYAIPIRHGKEAIKTQYVGEKGTRRKAISSEVASTVLQTEASRNALKKIMQTEKYKQKQSESKKGEKNGMYGVKGKYHPNWNNELSNEERIEKRHTYKDEQWRKSVFEKDNYTCQYCGDNKGHNLNAHHKNGHHWCKEQRYETDNGVTLCEECHKYFHSIYGYKNNTEEQFNEWINNK